MEETAAISPESVAVNEPQVVTEQTPLESKGNDLAVTDTNTIAEETQHSDNIDKGFAVVEVENSVVPESHCVSQETNIETTYPENSLQNTSDDSITLKLSVSETPENDEITDGAIGEGAKENCDSEEVCKIPSEVKESTPDLVKNKEVASIVVDMLESKIVEEFRENTAIESEDAKPETSEVLEQSSETIEFSVVEYVDDRAVQISQETVEIDEATSTKLEEDTKNLPEETEKSNEFVIPSRSSVDSDISKVRYETVAASDINDVSVDKLPATNICELPVDKAAISDISELPVDEAVIPDMSEAPIEKPNEIFTACSTSKQRSVIEDIFEDWQDENPEDECASAHKAHDSVEMELKILHDDNNPTQCEFPAENTPMVTENARKSSEGKAEAVVTDNESSQESSPLKETITLQLPHKPSKSTTNPGVNQKVIKQNLLVPRPGVKVPGFLLTSPIVSQTAVSKVLKERIREQQKEFDSPGKPDIFFVKKITQRLSHKLAAASAAQVPGLLPISSIAATSNLKKTTSNVDKELLAILEGDVDPDWSKPPTLAQETKSAPTSAVEVNSSPKLDPLIERELALKQLLELPSTPVKKKAPAKLKPKAAKAPRTVVKKEIVEETESKIEPKDKEELPDVENSQKSKIEETRSGRKRKPTEKAREHEISTKRFKGAKGKSPTAKRMESPVSIPSPSIADQLTEEKIQGSTEKPANNSIVSPEIVKKVTPKPGAKRKLSAQKLPPTKKPPIALKSTKVTKTTKKQQRNGETTISDVKPKKKVINEIDRLLQDEGVVNLLYDVEQPRKKRLVPITQSQTKVMDLQKIQRELKIRTKLVRNAVLRLRTSTMATSKVSPRSKRSVSANSESSKIDKKIENEPIRSTLTSPTEFIYPSKIRNAADASIIIRRHSSSSFSSASVSPRASIDGPERLGLDLGKFDDDDGETPVLRSYKRRYSQDEEKTRKKKKEQQILQSPESKRNRRSISERAEIDAKNVESEVGIRSPVSKKIEARKNSKLALKQLMESIDPDETSNSSAKIATRSNGAAHGKLIPKSKKSVKCKVSFAKGNGTVNRADVLGQQDELSACLAEAVTALSNDSGGSSRCKSTVPVNRNKTKGNSNSVKTGETDGQKVKLDMQVQFSNIEINVQRHGNLVQLLLTPSRSGKMRNGITLQIMQELRDTLAILRKDEDCRVVLLTSRGSSFCEGLELSTILHTDEKERRVHAQQLANGVKEFIKSLATFNKPIVAGVQGSAVGLGVTMLPWFDLVIASDKATFSTPYGKLGQIAEGAAIFTLSHILGSSVTSELLLGGRTLTANEALRAGLVSRVLWPDRFQAELLPSLRAMSEQSSQSMEATKALLRHSLRKKLDAALASENYLLVEHWCSSECQAAITAYIDEKIQ